LLKQLKDTVDRGVHGVLGFDSWSIISCSRLKPPVSDETGTETEAETGTEAEAEAEIVAEAAA
jgi:hypothetical protein